MRGYSYLLFLAALGALQYGYESGVIYQIVDGAFSNNGTFIFIIYSKDFKGVILHCIDSEGTNLGIRVLKEKDGNRTMLINFNMTDRYISSREFCGCAYCNQTEVKFEVIFRMGAVSVRCNNLTFLNISSHVTGGSVTDKENHLSVPLEISNGRVGIYIMMGNIGPYADWRNKTSNPVKENIEMCVNRFMYNNSNVSFIGGDERVRPSCLWRCKDNICNRGICMEGVYTNRTCDCRYTMATGRYCDRSLMSYAPRGNNSYEAIDGTTEIYGVLSWKTVLDKHQCLMNIVQGNQSLTVSIRNSQLLLDSSVISDSNGINSFSVNITNNSLIVKSKAREQSTTFLLSRHLRIHVGFSDNKSDCQPFEGAIDFNFNSSQLRQIPGMTTIVMDKDYTTRNSTTQTTTTLIVIITTSSVGGLIMLLLLLVIISYFIKVRKMKDHIEILTSYAGRPSEKLDLMYTDTGVYGLVEDNCNYDYITYIYDKVSDRVEEWNKGDVSCHAS